MKSKYTLLIVLVLVVALAAAGCARQKISEKIVESIAEKVAENQGEDVDIDIDDGGISISNGEGNMQISGGDDLDWPKDAPDTIPEFKGKIYSSMVSDDGLMVGLSDVKLDEFGAYTGILESKGFENESTFESSGTFMKQYVKDEMTLSVSYSEEAKTLTIIAQWE